MVFSSVLFCMFTVISLVLIVAGGSLYRQISDNLSSDYLVRTALSYVAGKERYNAAATALIADSGAHETLIFRESIDGTLYDTSIWFEDGSVHESFTRTGDPIPEGAAAIFELDSFDVSIDDNLLTVRACAKGKSRECSLCVIPESEAST